MRRTEQEFKDEVLRRSRAYQQAQARKRKTLLGTGLCVCLCFVALAVFAPMGGASADSAAGNKAAIRTEMSMAQSPEFALDAAAPMEKEPAAPEPEEEPVLGVTSGAAENFSVSRRYDVVAIEVKTNPEDEAQYRFFTDVEKVAAIIIAIERFYPADETQQEPEPMEGTAYEIMITHEDKTERYTLFGDGLCADSGGWIRLDANAARKLEKALSQESDAVPDVSVSKTNAANSWPLSPADAQVILGRLSGDWILSVANCLCDYTLYVSGETYRYHSDCGTIQNESGQSMTFSEADKQTVNEILESYTN